MFNCSTLFKFLQHFQVSHLISKQQWGGWA
jgi:hypothetical protein